MEMYKMSKHEYDVTFQLGNTDGMKLLFIVYITVACCCLHFPRFSSSQHVIRYGSSGQSVCAYVSSTLQSSCIAQHSTYAVQCYCKQCFSTFFVPRPII